MASCLKTNVFLLPDGFISELCFRLNVKRMNLMKQIISTHLLVLFKSEHENVFFKSRFSKNSLFVSSIIIQSSIILFYLKKNTSEPQLLLYNNNSANQ